MSAEVAAMSDFKLNEALPRLTEKANTALRMRRRDKDAGKRAAYLQSYADAIRKEIKRRKKTNKEQP